jgi:RNA recognition motif-containing protein
MQIFVSNLAFATTAAELQQLFTSYGTVATARIVTDPYTGRSRGFGFVEMPDATAAQAAIAGLQGTTFGDRTLRVEAARPREHRRPRRPRW